MTYRENSIEPVQPARCHDVSVGSSTQGLILPAGSSLVQFEIQRYADGAVDSILPRVVWVDRATPLKPFADGIACNCSGPFFPIRNIPGDIEVTCTFPGYTPSVCLCMGRFIE